MTGRLRGAEKPDDAGGETRIIDIRELYNLDEDPEKQAELRKLLIEEEDRLAKNRERLEHSARLVCEGQERIARLKSIKSTHNCFSEQLRVMETIQQLYDNFHQRLLTEYP